MHIEKNDRFLCQTYNNSIVKFTYFLRSIINYLRKDGNINNKMQIIYKKKHCVFTSIYNAGYVIFWKSHHQFISRKNYQNHFIEKITFR